MAEHLLPEVIRLLSEHKLTGTAFAEALVHIEHCDECRKLLPQSSRAEIIERLLLSGDQPSHERQTAKEP